MRLDFHLIVGLFLGTLLYFFTDLGIVVIFLAVAASLIPDLDVIPFFFKKRVHRQLFHNVWFVAIVSAVFYFAFGIAAIGALLGFAVHILSDAFTFFGVYPTYPFRREKKLSLADLYLPDKKTIRLERIAVIISIILTAVMLYIKNITLDSYMIFLFVFLAVIFFIGESNRSGIWKIKRAPQRPEVQVAHS